MKQFFKYQFGYINIDEENLYMTNSGNWSEVSEVQEKSTKTKAGNMFRSGANWIFLVLVVGLVVLGFLSGVLKGRIGLLGLVGTPVFIYFFYRYLQRDLGVKYKIPIAKITSVELKPEEKKAILHFLNATNQQDQEVINKVEKKGFEILGYLNNQEQ